MGIKLIQSYSTMPAFEQAMVTGEQIKAYQQDTMRGYLAPIAVSSILLVHAESDLSDSSGTATSFDRDTAGVLPTISSAQKKFGSYSALMSRASNSNCKWNSSAYGTGIGTGPFTLDFWWYPTSTNGGECIVYWSAHASGGCLLYLASGNGGTSRIVCSPTWGATYNDNGVATYTANQWQHIAVVGNGGADGSRNVKLYKNGVLKHTVTGNYIGTTNSFRIGGNDSYGSNGYMDEIHITNTQLWTADFTPPVVPYA